MQSQGAATARLSHVEIRSIVIGIMLAMFLGALDQTIVAAALPTIGHELGDFENVSWVASIYLLAATAVTPLYGKFSDIHGRRITLLIAISTFVIGSVACAVAPTMLVLITARGLQGLGGGGLISLAQTIVADVVAPRERGRYQIYLASVFLLASLAGPTLGGFFTEHLHWSLIFWINIPLGVAAYFMTSASLRLLPRHERPHKLDVLGAVLLVTATVALMLAISYGGVRYPWDSAPILGLAGFSLAVWCLFALRILTASEPLIPIELLSDRVVLMGTASACFGMGTYIGLTIYMPVFFQTVRGLSASNSGLALIPLMVGTVVGATASGQVMAHAIHYKRLPIGGIAVALAGTLILAYAGETLPVAAVEAVLALVSIGVGTLLPTTTVAIQNAVKPHQMGTVTGTMNFFRQLGSALLVAGFGALLLNGAGHQIGTQLTGQPAIDAFRLVFLAASCGFALALLFIILMKEQPLRGGAKQAAEAVIAD